MLYGNIDLRGPAPTDPIVEDILVGRERRSGVDTETHEVVQDWIGGTTHAPVAPVAPAADRRIRLARRDISCGGRCPV